MNRRLLTVAAALLTGLSAGLAGAYTVQKGDTLYSIASANGLSVDELRRLNNLQGNSIALGQVLRLSGTPESVTAPSAATGTTSGKITTANTALPQTKLPPPLSAEQLAPTPSGTHIEGVDISVPDHLTMGDAFVIRLTGANADKVTASFPSEVGEDVRQPNEVLKPIGAAGEYRILGRVVLGKTSPLVYEIRLGTQMVRGRIPVSDLDQPIQHLILPAKISGLLKDDGRAAEEKAVEKVYALRTPQAWNKPFVPAVTAKAISSTFGQPRTYTTGGPISYHYGLDFPAPVGTPISAINDGTVVLAGHYPVRGNVVAIDHGNGVVSLYFHQSKLLVKVGDHVTRGQKIGQIGVTGLSAGPHLHLELRVRGEATDPRGWIGRLWPR